MPNPDHLLVNFAFFTKKGHPSSFLTHGRGSHQFHRVDFTSNRNREEYLKPIPETERGDMILAYHAQLNCADDEVRKNAAKAWSRWE